MWYRIPVVAAANLSFFNAMDQCRDQRGLLASTCPETEFNPHDFRDYDRLEPIRHLRRPEPSRDGKCPCMGVSSPNSPRSHDGRRPFFSNTGERGLGAVVPDGLAATSTAAPPGFRPLSWHR